MLMVLGGAAPGVQRSPVLPGTPTLAGALQTYQLHSVLPADLSGTWAAWGPPCFLFGSKP